MPKMMKAAGGMKMSKMKKVKQAAESANKKVKSSKSSKSSKGTTPVKKKAGKDHRKKPAAKKTTYKTTAKTGKAVAAGAKKAQQASKKTGPSAAEIKKQKQLQAQRDEAIKASKAANKKANAASSQAEAAKKALGVATSDLNKAKSALGASQKAQKAAVERASKAEFENAALVKEVALKQEAFTSLKSSHTSLTNKLNMYESEEAKMQRMINEQTLKMQEQAQAILDSMNDEADEPPIVIDGISSGYASPKASEKLYQDQTAVEIDIDTIDDLDDLSISILRPEILIKHKGSYRTKDSTSGIGSNKYLDLFAGNILRELLHTDASIFSFTQFADVDQELLDSATQRVESVHEIIDEEVEALVAYRSMINQAIMSLDLHECSEEIGSLMLDSVSEIMQPEDGFVEDLPTSLVELVETSDAVKFDIASSYSNTKLYYSILATIYESFMGYADHLGTTQSQVKAPLTYRSVKKNRYSLPVLKKNQENQLKTGSKTVVQKGFSAIFTPIRTNAVTSDLQQLLCCLSNELLMSCGINRMNGTELGNKYGVTSDNPLTQVMGTNMSEMYKSSGAIIPDIIPTKGSLLDFITSEDTDSHRVVLPFEVNDITLQKKKYLPGSDYLVEGPARKLDISFSDPIGSFSENFSGEVTSAKQYLFNLLSLEESTLLSPQGILIRVLEDIYTLCLEAAKPVDLIDVNSMYSVIKFSIASATKKQRVNWLGKQTPYHAICSTDTIAILRNILDQEDQPDYRLSIDPLIISELDATNERFINKAYFDVAFNYNWKFHIGSRVKDTKSNSIIPLNNHHKVKINIQSESETPTVHKMIIDLVDELMAESESFASRDGSSASYKNNQGRTAFSNIDYSGLMAIVQQLYHVLIKQFVHWTPVEGSQWEYRRAARLETSKNQRSADAILAILNTYKEGSKFADLFDETGNALSLDGVSSSTKIGTHVTMGSMIDAIENMRNHRSYLKCNIAALEAIATNISQKSTPLSTFQKSAREVITNKTKIENVKDSQLSSFCSLVKLPVGSDALRGLTSMQCSNTILSKQRLKPTSSLDMRQSRAVLSEGLIEALKVFHESALFRGTENIMCVGLPNGMIDKLKTSNVDANKREPVSNTSSEFSLVFTNDNELFSSLAFDDYSVDYDASLYLFPDSYDGYTPPEDDEGGGLLRNPDPLRDLIEKTVFHRIVAGVIVESETGSTLIEEGDDKTYEVLRNHVYSDLVRISVEYALMMGICEADLKKYTDLNVAGYSSEGYELMRSMQSSPDVNMMTVGVQNLLEPMLIDEKNVFYRIGTSKINKDAYNLMTENDQNDVVRFASSSLFTAELDRHKILSTSTFDRIFYVQVNSDDFVLDSAEGLLIERKRHLGQTVPKQGKDTFDLSGMYCEVRVK